MTDQNILLQENGYPNAPDIKALRTITYAYIWLSAGPMIGLIALLALTFDDIKKEKP